ncbi:MAG: helicase-related protein [Acidimicrobiia bacterium]|nr:helicase-related protein [Acidimicrobiia bacterium]
MFTYFADTVDWIVEHLDEVVAHDERLAPYRGRIAATSGTHGRKEEVLFGFAPVTTEAPPGSDEDLFDLVVSTDVLAEGVNLQQARHIVNFDLPWNPMRLVQRHGRIDRIGSDHSEVFLRCVFPDRRLDDLLGLEERLHRKLTQAARTIGVAEVLPGSASEDQVFGETHEQIERLREGDATIFEEGGTGRSTLSGEEYRQGAARGVAGPRLQRANQGTPLGIRERHGRRGVGRGFVFCVQIGDHDGVRFVHVNLSDPDAPVVETDTLACLATARPPKRGVPAAFSMTRRTNRRLAHGPTRGASSRPVGTLPATRPICSLPFREPCTWRRGWYGNMERQS